MRLYAFLLLASFALAARAATIPENAPASIEKKIDVLPEDKDQIPENVPSDQELVVKDVDNNLRKPADIPVEVIVQDAKAVANADEQSEEIVRQAIDLNNPGPPQRQEHETQNPAFYAAEQQVVQTYKQNLNDAQIILRQGFQGVSDGIQNMFENNEQIKLIQQSIQTLREGFIAQINKLNGTIQNFLNADSTNEVNPVQQQTKANIQIVESGLNTLKNDFTKGVKTLADGVDVFASLRAENEKPEENKPTSPAAPPPLFGPGSVLLDYINRFQNNVQSGMNNLTNTLNGIVAQGQNFFTQGQQSTAAPASVPAGAQSDTQAPAAPAQPANPWFNFQNPFNFLNPSQTQNTQVQNNQQQTGPFVPGTGPFAQAIQNIQSSFNQLFQLSTTQTPPTAKPDQNPKPSQPESTQQNPSEPTQSETKPETKPESNPQEEVNPKEPVAQANQAEAVTPVGPIRQILQNNPITQGIAGAVQRLQNINNPEKPREPEKEKSDSEVLTEDDKLKGHSPGSGDNNDSVVRVEQSETTNEVVKEPLPEVQEPTKEQEVKQQNTEAVPEKTE